jgi:long-chain acyl-CoA synthetase
MFDQAVATAPDKVALRHFGVTLTYRQVGGAVEALAQRLAPMVEPGEVVALVLPNSIEFHIAYFAALKALAVPALLNPLYPAAQLSLLLREATARAAICAPATRDLVTGLAGNLGIPGVVCLGQDVTVPELVLEAGAALGLWAATPADSAALLFSGGTTGLPKVVEHTHGRLVAAVRHTEYIWPTGDADVFLPIAPFTHIYGFVTGVLVPLSARGETVIPERFQPEHIVELLARYRVTFFGGGPPAIYAGLLAARNLGSADLSALRVCPPAAHHSRSSSWSAGGTPRGSRSTRATACRKYRRSAATPRRRACGRAQSANPCPATKYKSWIWTPGCACCRRARGASCESGVPT